MSTQTPTATQPSSSAAAQPDTAGVRVLSYNLREHRAVHELESLAESQHLDVLCLQECDTPRMPQKVGSLELAGMTSRNRLGLALYYNAQRFDLEEATTYALRKSMHDRVMSPAHERLLAADLVDKVHGRHFLAGSFHAAPLSAGNALRRHQIDAALKAMRALEPNSPILMVGDYNYPWFQRGLQRAMTGAGYLFSRSDAPTYRYRFFRGHFDFAVSDLMQIDRVQTLTQGVSDHLPVLVEAHYAEHPVPPKA